MAKKTAKTKKTTKAISKKTAKPTVKTPIKQKAEKLSPLDKLKLPDETKKKLQKIKEKLDSFKTEALKKFSKYIMGISVMPPPKPVTPKEIQMLPKTAIDKIKLDYEENKNKIHLLILIDDADSKKMSKFELKRKLSKIMQDMAAKVDEKIKTQTIILSELWQSCFDGKYEILRVIAMSAPIHDTGMLAAIKISEVHKTMVLKKFEKYIVSYVLSGSLVKGKATPKSDVDVWIVIDDTDVKRMSTAELRDKLRSIIYTMGFEAGSITGIKNKINIQPYLLTDFWDGLKEANPVYYTLLRDGVPLFDKGMFMPWKQLLKKGKIKPSQESIEMFMSTGEQMLKRVNMKIRNLAIEDCWWALTTPAQAALMLYGMSPPAPSELPDALREIFVKKEGLLEEKYVKIYEKANQLRKDVEHGTVKEVDGKELDEYVKNAEAFLKRLKKLFDQMNEMKEKKDITHIYDTILTVTRDVLKVEKIENIKNDKIVGVFNTKLIQTGIIPDKYLRTLKEITKAHEAYKKGKLKKAEITQIKKQSTSYIRYMIEFLQRKRSKQVEKMKVRIKYKGGKKFGEVIIVDNTAFITHDMDSRPKKISKALIGKEGGLAELKESSDEEKFKAIEKAKTPKRIYITNKLFADLKRIFNQDIEILVNY